ncbi:substrate-binding domain-containing protein, partial [Enterococcus faecalis]
FDDIQAAAFVEPPLTTMAQDFKEMGKLAGEVLLQTMQQDLQIIEDIQVPVTLIERETISTVSK